MKISVTQNKLSKALNIVSRIAIGKVTLPILNNVLIRVSDKKVSLVTTNLDMAVRDFLPVSSSEDGVITVPAKLLAEFVSNLPQGEKITIETKGAKNGLGDTKVSISAGNYSSTINGAPADDFPELPEINEKTAVTYKMNVDEFKTSINSVIIACSTDLSRPALTGVYFNTQNDQLAIAATDGYRLTEKILIDKVKSEVKAIVPATSLQEVLRSITDDMDGIEITFSEESKSSLSSPTPAFLIIANSSRKITILKPRSTATNLSASPSLPLSSPALLAVPSFVKLLSPILSLSNPSPTNSVKTIPSLNLKSPARAKST